MHLELEETFRRTNSLAELRFVNPGGPQRCTGARTGQCIDSILRSDPTVRSNSTVSSKTPCLKPDEETCPSP